MAQPPGPWTFTTAARANILDALDNWGAGGFKVALFTSGSNIGVSSTTYAGVTSEVAAGNGYTTGGVTVALTLTGTTSINIYFTTPPVWTASSSGITAYYAAIYGVTSGKVICYCLLDSTPQNVTVVSNTLTLNNNNANPICVLA